MYGAEQFFCHFDTGNQLITECAGNTVGCIVLCGYKERDCEWVCLIVGGYAVTEQGLVCGGGVGDLNCVSLFNGLLVRGEVCYGLV